MRGLIINADGYGFTPGISRAIEECVDFGTVRSISVNVNFDSAERLSVLARRHPDLSIGCHVNPVVGRPVLDPKKVPSLLNGNGEFLYKDFVRQFLRGCIRLEEMRAEMNAQIDKIRALTGGPVSHVDFHMGLHRLPKLYELFLDVAESSGVRRIRTHKYRVGMESNYPRTRNFFHMFGSGTRIPKYFWNIWLRRKAARRKLSMPDRRVEITNLALDDSALDLNNYLALLRNLPRGVNEFVVHPGYADESLQRWSTYLHQRELELRVFTSKQFKDALHSSGVRLMGYLDIPLKGTGPHARKNATA